MTAEFKRTTSLTFPVYDLRGFETDLDRMVEVEVAALIKHMGERGKKRNAPDTSTFLCGLIEFTARLIVAGEKQPGAMDRETNEAIDALAANLVARCHAIMGGKGPSERADA